MIEGRTLEIRGQRVAVLFEFDPDLVTAIKLVRGARWEGAKGRKFWTVPAKLDYLWELGVFAKEHGFFIPSELRDLWVSLVELRKTNLAGSVAAAGTMDVPGLGGVLLPFQCAGVAYGVRTRRCIIADEMGLGKTIQALAILQKLDAFPAVVVCPASLKYTWEREALKWLPGKVVHVVGNGSPLVPCLANPTRHAHLNVINYDLLGRHLERLRALEPAAVIFDESHRIKNGKAQRTVAAKALARGVGVRLLLSGTPVENRPEELLAPLQILGRLEDMGGFWHFAERYCGAQKKRFSAKKEGWDFSRATNLPELNAKLRGCCLIRRLKRDVLSELPAKRRAVVPVHISNGDEYRAAQRDVLQWIANRAAADPEFRQQIAHLSDEQRLRAVAKRAQRAADRAENAEELVKVGALMQIAALGKLEAAFEWIGSFLESGEKLVVFAEHKAIVEAVSEKFGCGSITGQTALKDRQGLVDDFQLRNNMEGANQMLVLNWKAGGVGITLTAASNVLGLELPWTPGVMEQGEDRTHRIGQRNSVNAWYLLGKGTLDWGIWELLKTKRAIAQGALGDTL